MRMPRRNSFFQAAIVFIASLLLGIDSNANAAELVLDELLAAREQWLSELTVKSTFLYREGTADSRADALDGEPFDNIKVVGRGVFHKRGGLVRHSIEFDGGPELLGQFSDQGTIEPLQKDEESSATRSHQSSSRLAAKNVPKDEVRNEQLLVTFSKRWDHYFDNAVFMNRVDIASSSGTRGCTNAERLMSPINPITGCFPRMPGELNSAKGQITYKVVQEVNGISVVTGENNWTIDGKPVVERYRAEWSMEHDYPMITRIIFESIVAERKTTIESVLSDLRQSGELSVPAKVLSVIEQGDVEVLVREWSSEDLGNELPTDDDFVIDIPETTRIYGLAEAELPGKPRKLQLASTKPNEVFLAKKDIEYGMTQQKPITANNRKANGSLVLIAINVALVLTLAATWYFRNVKKQVS